MLRFQFLNNKLGPLVVEPDDPIGINELTKTIKRSSEFDGIVFEIVFDIEFIKVARSYLKAAFETDGGVDALVIVNIYKDNPNTRKWNIYSEGTVNFNKYDVYEDKIAINIEQTGLQRRVTNLIDTDLDLETVVSENGNGLPEQNIIPALPLHSKTILKALHAYPPREGADADTGDPGYFVEYQFENVFKQELPGASTTYRERIIFGQMSTQEAKVDELEEGFQTPFGYSDMTTLGIEGAATAAQTRDWMIAHPDIRGLFNVFKFKEAGILSIDLLAKVIHEIEGYNESGDIDACGTSPLGQVEIYHWVELRDQSNQIVFLENIGTPDMGPCSGTIRNSGTVTYPFTRTENIKIGYKLYWFHTVRIYADYDNDDVGKDEVTHHFRITPVDGYYFKLSSQTSAAGSTTKAVLLYEAVQRCVQFYTNEVDCFYSDLLGRTDVQLPGAEPGTNYPSDGAAAFIAYTNGGNLRGLDKPIFANLNDLIEFINSIFCVGFGFEKFEDGKQRFRLEFRSHFYNKNNKILSLGAVYNIRKSIDSKRYYNQIEYGYASKIDIGQTNAIDAFNTKRRTTIPIVNTKNQLKIATKIKADGYQIEQARRLRFQTTDGKNDDEPFVIVVIREVLIPLGTFSIDNYRSKRDEGYELIENVFDSPTGYNYDISPGRALRNWFKIIGSAIIYSKSKIIKFSYGEVNFLMRTKKWDEDFIVEENGNVDLTDIEPDYDNFIYNLQDVDITDELVQAICDNPYGYIEFEDRFGEVMSGYISDNGIEHDSNKGKADFKLLKVFRP